MAGTRNTLAGIESNLAESLGVREYDSRPRLSPVPLNKDVGRRPLRNVGKIDINSVIPDPDQPRTEFSEEAIDRLAMSIREKGQLSAIRVRWSEELGKWVIVAGERRWRATKRAGLPTIDYYFHEGDLTRPEVLEQQLIENCLREDLRPIEEARAFSMLMELNGWSAKHLAEAIRIEQSRISRALALLRLPADIQEHVDEGQLSARSAYELSKLQDDGSRRELAEEAASGRLTHEDVAKVVRQRRGKQKAKPRNTRQVFTTKNGYRVVVSANKKGTYREIEQALRFALEEVRHRIASNTKMS